MDDDGLQTFLSKAAAHRLLTPYEEKALGRRVQKGTKQKGTKREFLTQDALAARDELVLCNIRLVVSVARYYRNRGLPMDDIVQYGTIGLNRAAEKFDPRKETRFSTYATLWIKQAIQRGLSASGTAIRLPSSVAASRAKVRTAQLKYPEADHEFLADLLDLDVKDVARALEAAEVVTSLDREMVTDDHSHTMLDAIADPFAVDPQDVTDDINDDLRAALDLLEQVHERKGAEMRLVIELHFGLTGEPPLSVKQIQARIDLTNNTVKARRTEGLAFLEAYLEHRR